MASKNLRAKPVHAASKQARMKEDITEQQLQKKMEMLIEDPGEDSSWMHMKYEEIVQKYSAFFCAMAPCTFRLNKSTIKKVISKIYLLENDFCDSWAGKMHNAYMNLVSTAKSSNTGDRLDARIATVVRVLMTELQKAGHDDTESLNDSESLKESPPELPCPVDDLDDVPPATQKHLLEAQALLREAKKFAPAAPATPVTGCKVLVPESPISVASTPERKAGSVKAPADQVILLCFVCMLASQKSFCTAALEVDIGLSSCLRPRSHVYG